MKIKLSELKQLIKEELIKENYFPNFKDQNLKKWAQNYEDVVMAKVGLFFTEWMTEDKVKQLKKLVDSGKRISNGWAKESNLKEKLEEIKNNKKGWKLFDYDKVFNKNAIEIIIYK
jgi:hypothetical protein